MTGMSLRVRQGRQQQSALCVRSAVIDLGSLLAVSHGLLVGSNNAPSDISAPGAVWISVFEMETIMSSGFSRDGTGPAR